MPVFRKLIKTGHDILFCFSAERVATGLHCQDKRRIIPFLTLTRQIVLARDALSPPTSVDKIRASGSPDPGDTILV